MSDAVPARSAVPEIAALQERWDGFLAKIETRHSDVLAEAEPALLQIVYDDPGEMEPLGVAWQGIRSQLMELARKIDDTWTQKVGPQFEVWRFDIEDFDYYIEHDKGTDLSQRLHHEMQRAQIKIMGKAGLHVQQAILARVDMTLNCSQCAAPIPVTTNIYRAHYENCEYCKTVNTYTPATELREIEWFSMDNIAAYHCIEEWEAMTAISEAYSAQRRDEPETVPYQKVADANHAYYSKFLRERVKIVPELEKTLDADIEKKLEWLGTLKRD